MEELRKLSQEEIKEIIKEHNKKGGKKADFSYTDLRWTNFSSVELIGANFKNADLSFTIFEKTKINNSRFDRAKMFGANLSKAKMFGSSFDYTDLTSANLEQTDLRRSTFNRTNFKNAIISHTSFQDSKFFGISGIKMYKVSYVGHGTAYYLAQPDLVILGDWQGSLESFEEEMEYMRYECNGPASWDEEKYEEAEHFVGGCKLSKKWLSHFRG